MGGRNSGYWPRINTKPTQENFDRLNIVDLKRDGLIGKYWWSSGVWQWSVNNIVRNSVSYSITSLSDSPHMRVQYVGKFTSRQHDYQIALTTTRPQYGGLRWWFLCPAQGCGRRIGVLYLGEVLACRHCHRMAYVSQNESSIFTRLKIADRLHRQLGGEGNAFFSSVPEKPKGMHWKTYFARVNKIQTLRGAIYGQMVGEWGLSPVNCSLG